MYKAERAPSWSLNSDGGYRHVNRPEHCLTVSIMTGTGQGAKRNEEWGLHQNFGVQGAGVTVLSGSVSCKKGSLRLKDKQKPTRQTRGAPGAGVRLKGEGSRSRGQQGKGLGQ